MKFSKEEKTMWLEDWQQSGKSAWTYAKENGIAPQTFVNWTKKNKERKQGLIEVPMPILQSTRLIQEILIEKGDMKIHIPLSCGGGELRKIFGVLGNVV